MPDVIPGDIDLDTGKIQDPHAILMLIVFVIASK